MADDERVVFEDDELSDEVSEFFSAVGKQLKLFREQAGLTQREFARRAGYSENMIGSVERGRRTPRVELLEAADELLGARGALKIVAEDVMKAKAKMRLTNPAFSKAFTKEESQAVEIHGYSTLLVPGLLQTEAHARALYQMRRPWLTEGEVEQWVAARMERQEILNRSPLPVLSWVLDESVLQRPLGGWDVHLEQLRRLVAIGRMWGVELQVMPLDRTEQAGMGGPFTLLTPSGRPQIAYVEVQHVNRLITDSEEVRRMAARYSSIRAQALTLQESLTLIEKMLGER
ncbi:helix-turn-helix domain-containing protein [Kitasatospora sp. NPDC092286]|uniref:helix-turn-helix domain-containing protein n=1 Tax=Kitasatospora sp. NPDC092286 TaxID=3364087 RepID=UPI003826C4DE